ncbi:MAG: TrkA family potassium uptake protein [Clostridia bacterium]
MKLFNREKHENIIIAGCGNFGTKIASVFAAKNDNVTIIDIKEQSLPAIANAYNYYAIEGDATDLDTLEYAGIKTADLLIAATNDDNTNIMIAKIAKEYYRVNQVITRIEDTSKEAAYNKTGIIAICPLDLSLNELQHILIKEKELIK